MQAGGAWLGYSSGFLRVPQDSSGFLRDKPQHVPDFLAPSKPHSYVKIDVKKDIKIDAKIDVKIDVPKQQITS